MMRNKKFAFLTGATALSIVLGMDLERYRTTRPTWEMACRLRRQINAISDRRQRDFITHATAISQIQEERDKLHGLLPRMWWFDRLRMRLWLWLVDDMIDLLKQGSVRTVYFQEVG